MLHEMYAQTIFQQNKERKKAMKLGLNCFFILTLFVLVFHTTSTNATASTKGCLPRGAHPSFNHSPVGSWRCEQFGGKYVKVVCQPGGFWKEVGPCSGSGSVKPGCPHSGKTYSVSSTRCTGNKKYICQQNNTWKQVGACGSGPKFCTHAGRKYKVGEKKCVGGLRGKRSYKCLADGKWKDTGKCP